MHFLYSFAANLQSFLILSILPLFDGQIQIVLQFPILPPLSILILTVRSLWEKALVLSDPIQAY